MENREKYHIIYNIFSIRYYTFLHFKRRPNKINK
jgi:hypothetical protein